VHAPFRAYRDDLALNWLIPNGLPFDTQRNVFSRLPKNDFGAGGAHHHLWLAFYRPPRTRLTDLQLSHTVSPDGFRFGLFLGERARGLFEPARRRLAEQPAEALPILKALLADGFVLGVGRGRAVETLTAPLDDMPAALARADRFFVERRLSRDALQALGPGLVAHALGTLGALWPLYRWLDAAADDAAEAPRSA
jgi:hypothetical protein